MHTQKVNLCHFDLILLHDRQHGDSRDGGVQLALAPHTDEPVLLVVGRGEGPPQELAGVVEAECVVVVLDVVLGEEGVQLGRTIGVPRRVGRGS